MDDDDVIGDAATALDPRLRYPSRHDWNWIALGDEYWAWLDAAYPAINQLALERDKARAEAADHAARMVVMRAELARRTLERDEARAACSHLGDELTEANAKGELLREALGFYNMHYDGGRLARQVLNGYPIAALAPSGEKDVTDG